MNTKGSHYTACLWGVDSKLLDDIAFCELVVREACALANCSILGIHKHKFYPQGVSINATLSSSHCAIHTWPEEGYCAIDMYGCGDQVKLDLGIAYFVKKFNPTYSQIERKDRGVRHA